MTALERNLETRRWLLERLRAEIVGPDANGRAEIIVDEGSADFRFASWEEFRKPKRQSNGEEVLWQDRPTKRYGAGILYPAAVTDESLLADEPDESEASTIASAGDDPVSDKASDAIEKIAERPIGSKDSSAEGENFDVALANAYRPSAIGVSFLADLDEAGSIMFQVHGAMYVRRPALVTTPKGDRSQELWLRKPLLDADGKTISLQLTTNELRVAGTQSLDVPGHDKQLQVVVLSRPQRNSDARLVTVSLVNRRERAGTVDEHCYFQVGLTITGRPGAGWVIPYPDPSFARSDEVTDESINKLLYRDRYTYAVGHGCAATWDVTPGEDAEPRATAVQTDVLPAEETPSITADLVDADGLPIRVSMRDLAGLAGAPRFDDVDRLFIAYEQWIETIADIDAVAGVVLGVVRPPIPQTLHPTAEELLGRCRASLLRMRRGLQLVYEDPKIRHAFMLANEVMLISQLRSSRDVRMPTWMETTATIEWDRPAPAPELSQPDNHRGYWRAFQIAFILQSIESISDPTSADREIVDVIWFPTGGGKTEAYLGLTAFTLLYHRLAKRSCPGATVLMRYTLRLLTTQQFQRAGLLFCAMEDVRLRNKSALGDREFSLGMWVGGTSTPNRRADAVAALTKLEKEPTAENPFVLLKCPWCNAYFGPSSQRGSAVKVYGYKRKKLAKGTTVEYACADKQCLFHRRPLPLIVIDEDLYAAPPDLIIGTVDKFALLAWKPEIRAFFGIGPDGVRIGDAPALVIQDELHLIAGPLGSMVGAYETVIEELCTSENGDKRIRPKIVASTATISRAADQIRAVYGRSRMAVFPASGLEAGDSFFAREARDKDGVLAPGRLYVGVMATSHGSLQTTQARVFATLLQGAAMIDAGAETAAARDPWWTLLSFFNSLRELGGAATLLVADARDYLRVIIDRLNLSYQTIRQLRHVEELTSRIRSDEVPRAIQKLEQRYSSERGAETVDACLASSIIEVGVDIDRLSLMTITGQPKTTAQYIQVSSRVGRAADAPGLVITLYSPSKPRDRSHFERFTSYHRRLYAQVEPTSVTPFSPPAVDRALHGMMVALVRQLAPASSSASPRPFDSAVGAPLCARIEEIVRQRVHAVDHGELPSVETVLQRRWREWKAWDPSIYGTHGVQPVDAPLIYPAGATPNAAWNAHGWPTLTSLRDVDATCEADVTQVFNDATGGV